VPPSVGPDGARAFGDAWREAGLGPLFLHAPYMVNVASPNPDFRRRSVNLARATVALAEGIGAAHVGHLGTTPDGTFGGDDEGVVARVGGVIRL